MVLAYYISQSEICGVFQRDQTILHDLLDDVLHVLDFCAELDPVARTLARTLSAHRADIRRFRCDFVGDISNLRPGTRCETPTISALLLAKSPENVLLQHCSTQIAKQLCNPYADHDVETSPDRRIQYFSGASRPCSNLTTAILNQEDGYFVDSPQPSHWTTHRSSHVYLQGATNIEVL
jgi:hypothetical protein